MVNLQRDMHDSGISIARGNKTIPKIAISLLRPSQFQIKILRRVFAWNFIRSNCHIREPVPLEYQIHTSIDVLLKTASLLELCDKVDGFVGRARPVLRHNVYQRALDVFRHSLGIAADVNMRAFGEPRP
jgi:hypothetical protein